MDNQNQNPNQETDILVLLDYFKNGFKKIFTGIGNLFRYILHLILWFFVLLKRYTVLVLVCVILFSIIGYYNKRILPPSYVYEMVVQPNFNSAKSLYQLVDSYDELAGTDDLFFKNIKQIKIAPVKSFTNDLDVFYNVVNNNSVDKRDTIFSKEYKIETFRKNIVNTDYPLQTIILKSSSLLSTKEIKKKILDPIETDPYFSQYKNSVLKSLEIKTLYYKKDLQRIDTLLLAQINAGKSRTRASSSLSINGDSKNNLEDDLLKRSSQITDALAGLEMDKATFSNVVKVISEPQMVDNKSSMIKRGTLSFAGYGFIFSLLIIFLIQFVKYLNKFEKEHS